MGAARGVRSRMVRLAAWEGIGWVALAFGLTLSAAMLADRWWHLPKEGRMAGGLVVLGVTLWVAWRRVILPLWRLPRGEALALHVERRRPDLRSRLISAIQLSRGDADSPEAAAFIRRLVTHAQRVAGELDPRELVPGDALRRAAWRIVPGLGVVLAGWAAAWPLTGVLLRRALLEDVPVPRATRLVEVSGERTVGRGDDVVLWARAEGVIPAGGILSIRYGSGRVQTLPLDADPEERGRFGRVLANLPSSFDYRIRVNDAESGEFRVEVLPRPVVTNLTLVQRLPEYTGLPERVLAPGELTLLRGSRLRVGGVASQPLSEAVLRLGGIEERIEARIDDRQPERFEAEIGADDPRLSSLSVEMRDRRGIPSRDSAVYAVQVVPDRAPRVRMILPARREELATPQGQVLLSFEATDDYGLGALRLMHRSAGLVEQPAMVTELDLEGDRPATVRRRFSWALGEWRPPPVEGELVEFWIEAADLNVEDGPGLGRSERYLLRVVTEAEKRADLLGRAGDAISRLGDVAQGQERLNESLGRIILARPPAR